jgi:AcrR family transcriptional regulator
MADSGTRTYRSSVRAAQARATRQRILDAATGLFAARGWSGTGMREVAEAAGVSVETVYKNFSSKGELLHRVLDVIVAGDDDPVVLAERPEYRAMGVGSLHERAQAAAALMTAINSRQAPVVPAMREAAAVEGEGELSDLLAYLHERRRVDFRRGGSLLADRPLTDTEVDGIWAILSVDVYLLLTRVTGWTDADYQTWAGDTLVSLLGGPPPAPRTARPPSRGGTA